MVSRNLPLLRGHHTVKLVRLDIHVITTQTVLLSERCEQALAYVLPFHNRPARRLDRSDNCWQVHSVAMLMVARAWALHLLWGRQDGEQRRAIRMERNNPR